MHSDVRAGNNIAQQMEKQENSEPVQVSAFYKFTAVEDPVALKDNLDRYLADTGILGTVLIAKEGVNGTISGSKQEVECFIAHLSDALAVSEIAFKRATATFRPFHRMKVRLKKEIVTLGVEGIDPTREVGQYIPPEQWNALIEREDVVLVDTRNDYEFAVGSFRGALNPNTKSFREFPDYVDRNLDPEKTPKVAMFCTGGIRCEKATGLMLQKGFKEVYHLQGGILEYFNRIDNQESLWDGECFVFDERVTVNQNLEQGEYRMCHACRMPLSQEDIASEHYEEGISCPHCHEQLTDEKRERLQQRNLQMKLAKDRNDSHLGKRHSRHLVENLEDLG